MADKYHPTVNKIINLLKENNFWFETFEHEPVRTSEEAAKIRAGYSIHQGAKTMIIKATVNNQSKFVMLVYPADKKFDSKKVKNILKASDLRFATEQEVFDITGGVQLGGVPPFGNLFNLEVYADPSLFENEKMIFNAGDKRFSIAMKTKDYLNLVKPNTGLII